MESLGGSQHPILTPTLACLCRASVSAERETGAMTAFTPGVPKRTQERENSMAKGEKNRVLRQQPWRTGAERNRRAPGGGRGGRENRAM